jgi:hypothetical protein
MNKGGCTIAGRRQGRPARPASSEAGCEAGLLATPPLVLLAAWREGARVGTPPRWLLNQEQRAEHDSTISPDLITAALQHVKVPALTKFLAGGGRLEFVVHRCGRRARAGRRLDPPVSGFGSRRG